MGPGCEQVHGPEILGMPEGLGGGGWGETLGRGLVLRPGGGTRLRPQR